MSDEWKFDKASFGMEWIVAILAVMMLSLLFRWASSSEAKEKAIENGCAQYNQTTGQFEWKNEAGKKN